MKRHEALLTRHIKADLISSCNRSIIHDLNTSLYIITGRAELLQVERPDDPIVQEHVTIILEQSEKLLAAIEAMQLQQEPKR